MIRFDLQRFAIKTVINGEVVEFLPVATTSDRGGVVVGDGVSVDSTGKISIPNATTVKSGLMSSSDKTKLNGIASGAQVNVIETIKVNGAALTPSSKSVNVDISGKVDKVSGKQLSTNDYTTNEKNKLSGIASGAQVNVIESISIDGTNQTISSKKVALNLSDYAKKSDIASGIRIKGSVNSFSDLPTNAVTGDLYNIKTAGGTDGEGIAIRAGDNVVRTEDGKWDVMAGTVDLNNYVQKDGSKVLSTNDYTTTEKNKLAGIASGAQVNVIETVKVNGPALTPSSKAVNIDISGKVDKVSGKQLSTNDYTTNEKNKLSSIASGAQVNVIETVKVDGTALNVSNKSVNIDISGKVDKVSGKGLSTNDYTTTEKNKLAGIDKQANKYVLPAAQSSVIGGVKVDSVANSNIVLSADGSISIPAASTSQAGVVKYGGGTSNYLRADGSWTAPPNTNNAMTQNISTVDSTYPILLTATANATANLGAKTAIFGSGVKVNPKTSVITAVGFNGSLEGNATSATKATKDGSDRVIVDTYETKANAITGVSASGRTITFTKGSGDTVTIQTQDNNTTYKVASSANITINGTLVPSVASGTTNKYLRSDGSWQIPPDNNTTYSAGTGLSLSGTTFGLKNASTAESGGVKLGGGTSNYLRADGSWATPPNTTYSVATSSANGLMSANDKKILDSVPSVYLTKTDASNTYLGKTAKAASATTADTATKFASAQTVTIGGDVVGSVSSQAGWSFNVVRRSCMIGQSSSTTTNLWYKVATYTSTVANDDGEITFLVEDTYNSRNYGILKAHLRTNGSKIRSVNECYLHWLVCGAYNLSDFVFVVPTTASPTVELWTKIEAGYTYRRFTVLSEGNRTATQTNKWTLLDASSAGQNDSITTTGEQIVSTIIGKTRNVTGVVAIENGGTRGCW